MSNSTNDVYSYGDKTTHVMGLPDVVRSASWWRAAGFPVPFEVPDNALGTLRQGCVEFTWPKESSR